MCLAGCSQIVLVVTAVATPAVREHGILHALVVGHLLHEVCVLGIGAVSLHAAALIEHDTWCLADLLNALRGLAHSMASVHRVHRLHVLCYYFILALLAAGGVLWLMSLWLELVPTGLLHLLFHLHSVDRHITSRILPIKAVAVMLLHIMGHRSTPDTHVIQAYLALVTLPRDTSCHCVVVLLWAR